MTLMPNSHAIHNDNVKFANQKKLQSCKALCTYVIKQIRVMKRPSSTKYSDALKESSEKSSELLQIDFILSVLIKR